MKIKNYILFILLFLGVDTKAYFVSQQGIPQTVTTQTCSPVKALCGQESQTEIRYFQFDTIDSDIGSQLGFFQNGTNWTKTYSANITAPGLTISPHNGTGNGYNSAKAAYVVMGTSEYKQEYRISPATGMVEKFGPLIFVRTIYSIHFQPLPSSYSPCTNHTE